MTTAVVTIIAKNYLAQARVLMDSVKAANPDFQRVVLLIDSAEGCFNPEEEDFWMVSSEELEIPRSRWFHFKYSVLELSTAVKPFFLSWLFGKRGIEKIIYLDPDIQVFAGLSSIEQTLDASTNIVITPHLTAELDDDSRPGELQILRSGTYNLGFIAVKTSPETDKFLRWWQVHLYDHCIVDLARGLFVDQRWIDLVPGLFSGVRILRDDGYNVAYWNAKHRRISWENGVALANGSPLYFFHFSGYDPEGPESFSKYQDRISLHDRGDLKQLCDQYREALFAKGFAESSRWTYSHSRFRNGEVIPDVGRHILGESPELLSDIEDPFSDEGLARITQVWNSPVSRGGPPVTKLAYRIYRMQEDAQAAMPDIFGSDYARFLEWMRSINLDDHVLSEPRLQDIRADLEKPRTSEQLTILSRHIYESRPDLQRVFPDPEGRDGAAYLGWMLTYGVQTYKLPNAYLASLRKSFRDLRSKLPFSSRLRLDFYVIWLRAGLFAGPRVTKMRRWRAPRPSHATQQTASAGVNVHGYFRAETGVGQSARNGIRAMKAAGIPFTVHNLDAAGHSEEDRSIAGYSTDAPHGTDLYFVNADQTEAVHKGVARSSYRIGFWTWELDELPPEWDQAFRAYDEIWVPSGFCQAAVAARSPVPVVRIPYCVSAPAASAKERADFAIPPDRFVFLTVFDMRSSFDRKNPLAVLRAFHTAFPDGSNCELVVKINHASADPGKLQALRDEAAGRRIRLVEETWRHEDVVALIRACDCLVSLHRSEGFGLVLGEAMLMEKPVITTAYSGNLDFTTPHTAFLVNYKLQEVGYGNAPYPPRSLWADPSVEDAARQMKLVYEDERLRTERARAGRLLIETQFSPTAIGRAMKARLQAIALRVR